MTQFFPMRHVIRLFLDLKISYETKKLDHKEAESERVSSLFPVLLTVWLVQTHWPHCFRLISNWTAQAVHSHSLCTLVCSM